MGTTWGYARVSTLDQNPALQVDALTAAGVPAAHIVVEHVSGAAKIRPAFDRLVAGLEAGDTLTVWKVDRLGRSTLAALETAQRLDQRGVRIVITTLGVDLTTPAGRLVFGVLCQIAEFERELTKERVIAGLAAAKVRGVALGRRHSLKPAQRREAAKMAADGRSYGEIGSALGVSRSVAFRAVQEERSKQESAV